MYIYFSKPRESGERYTILCIVDKEKRQIKTTVARCSKYDTFDPEIGIKICLERMQNKNYYDVRPYGLKPPKNYIKFRNYLCVDCIIEYLDRYHVKL